MKHIHIIKKRLLDTTNAMRNVDKKCIKPFNLQSNICKEKVMNKCC